VNDLKILVILPCHNEAASISQTIEDVRHNIPSADIWVVDNVSTDETVEIARRLDVVVFSEPVLGKGFAIRNAFSRVGPGEYDAIFMTDGDDTYSLGNFNTALKMIIKDGFDMVIGERIPQKFDSDSRRVPFRRGHQLGNILLSKVHEILFGIKIQDTLSGWRLMSPAFVGSFSGGATGFEIESELNAHCYTLKCKCGSVPVKYVGRKLGSDSKLNTYSDGLRILRRLLSLFRSERPLVAYILLSLPWLVGSLFLIRNVLANYFELHLIPNFPSLIAGVSGLTIAILLFVTGVLLENVRLQRVQAARFQFAKFAKFAKRTNS